MPTDARKPSLNESATALTDLVLAVFRANGALLALGDALVAPAGLTSARWQVLGAVALSNSLVTVPGIARAMGLSRQAVQKQVNGLLQEGLVDFEANPEHERSFFVRFTPKGRAAYAKADRLWRRRSAALAAALSPTEVEKARLVLDVLANAAGAKERT